MRKLWTLGFALCIAQVATAQTPQTTPKPATSTPPAQTQTQPPATTTPGAQSQGTVPAPTAATNKSAPQAKTKEEFDAYQAAVASNDANAADDFATKFPTSDLRALLYVNMMRKFQAGNDAERTMQMGRKAIALEPDNTWALVTTASVLSERTHSTDLDRDERYAEATKDAQTAVSTIDTGLVLPSTVTPEQSAMVKGILLSMAHGALGNVALEQGKYAEAEKHLKEAVEANKTAQQDAVTYLRLAISQDKQNKLTDAMANVDKAVELSAQDPQISAMAKQEKTRLEQLSGAAKK